MYKNQLQELAQRSCFNLPSYTSSREGPDHAPRFKATVNFNGEIFESPGFFPTLRQAENAAAEVALSALSTSGPSRSLAAKVLDETGVYKNLLQESVHRAGLKLPVYTASRSGQGHTHIFTCTVELAGLSFTGDPAKSKKQAQKNAALAAWSALKKLPDSGISSSSSSLLDHQVNYEQEQIIVARALANLRKSEKNLSSSRNVQRQQRPRRNPIRRDMHPTSNVHFYPMPFQSWVNHMNVTSMYQAWLCAQASEQQAQLLGLSGLPHPFDPRFFSVQNSGYQPSQIEIFPPVDLQPVIKPLTCFQHCSNSHSLDFLKSPIPVSPRAGSQITIQEILEEQNQEEGEWFNLPSEETVNSPFDVQDSSLRLCNRDVSEVKDSPEDNWPKCLAGCPDVPVGRDAISARHKSQSVTFASCSPYSPVAMEVQESQHVEGSQARSVRSVPRRTSTRYSDSSSTCQLFSGTAQSSDKAGQLPSFSSPHMDCRASITEAPELATNSIIRQSDPRVGVSRCSVPSVAPSVTLQTAVPVCSARTGALSTSCFMAPPVNVRSVVPVCSAPPRKPEMGLVPNDENQSVTELKYSLGQLRI